MTYLEAIRQALIDELKADPRVLLLGQDIGLYGGAFKVTEGLLERFGPERIIDTPITEAGAVGVAIGAALQGMRPVVEMQFMDFISTAFNMVTNFAATCHYRLGRAVPLVIRGPYGGSGGGGSVGAGPFHSQCPEGYFAHCPGLKIVAPGTVADAYALLRGAIQDPDPVIVLEHKGLYRHLKTGGAEVPAAESEGEAAGLGRSVLRRPGDDLTIVTYGALLQVALGVAEALSREGIEAGVVDLRTLHPLDLGPVLEAVRRSGRLIVAHEGRLRGGIGAEIVAEVSAAAFEYLDAPILRVAALDVPLPYSRALEARALPGAADLMEAARRVLGY